MSEHSVPSLKLSDLAYYGTGGTAVAIHRPDSLTKLADLMRDIASSGLPFFILGAGSNSLVMDEPWPGHVISLDQMQQLHCQPSSAGTQVIAGAGIENSALVQYCQDRQLGALAWMYRLPGQVGGTTRMNARCYGGEIGHFICQVHSVDPTGKIHRYKLHEGNRQQVFRGYKDTLFMRNQHIIAEVIFQLATGDPEKSLAKMQFCENDRQKKGQFRFPSCGCVFKNDYSIGVPSGMLLDRAGVHQLKHDKIAINPLHANFVFNQKAASSKDILEFTFQMQDLVYERFGVWLSYEMEVLGHLPQGLGHRFRLHRSHRNVHLNQEIQQLRQEFQNRG